MKGTYLIEVSYKKGVTDPVGAALEKSVRHLALGTIKRASSAQLYRIVGDLTTEQRTRIARELLCDPVIQEFGDGGWNPRSGAAGRKAAGPFVIDVWYKAGVTDARRE